MQPEHKKILKALVLELRHLLEGRYDSEGRWQPGDLEQRLAGLGVWRHRDPRPIDELSSSSPEDLEARRVVDSYLELRKEAGVSRESAVGEFIRETAYSWANRLVALRCMEARELIDPPVVQQKEVYGWRSLAHHRLVQRSPSSYAGDDEGLFTVLDQAFRDRASVLPLMFDPQAKGVALRPSVPALKRCLALLSGREAARAQELATDEVFQAPDALGWSYQYWNTEEKERVFERVRTVKGAKIEGGDIVPATQLYTEPYMVKFLVQNSLGATWMGMHPESRLLEGWEYFVQDADRAPVQRRPMRSVTFLDPACGSGHFLLEAFDLFFDMYHEEGVLTDDKEICQAILKDNLFGIDIDERAVQIAEAALWMKAAEKSLEFTEGTTNLVATNLRLPKGKDHLKSYLEKHPEDEPLRPALEAVFEGLRHADELGSLLQIEEPVERELKAIKKRDDERVAQHAAKMQMGFTFIAPPQLSLPLGVESFESWRVKTLEQLHHHFKADAVSSDLRQAFFCRAVDRGLRLFELLSRRYDVVAANPPYMGSKNMGPLLRSHIERHFTAGKRDIYAAFMLAGNSMCLDGGRIAVVVPQPWMFLRSLEGLRAARPPEELNTEDGAHTAGKQSNPSKKRIRTIVTKPSSDEPSFGGFIRSTAVECIAQLGRHAFEEVDPPANVVLFVTSRQEPGDEHVLTAVRIGVPMPSAEQARLLAAAAKQTSHPKRFSVLQRRFLSVPQSPIAFWLNERVLALFSGQTLGETSEVRQGLATADDNRFVRFTWEPPPESWQGRSDRRWVPFEKGGGYGKWFGHQWWALDWQYGGIRLQQSDAAHVQNTAFFFRDGWTYSRMARGAMGVRKLDPPGTFSDKGPSLFFSNEPLAEVLNSRAFSSFVRASSPSQAFEVDCVVRAPIPTDLVGPGSNLEALVALKKRLVSTDPTERAFVPEPVETLAVSSCLHALEGLSERNVFTLYGLEDSDIASVIEETGTPAGWYPALDGYSDVPPLPPALAQIESSLKTAIPSRMLATPAVMQLLRSRLRVAFEAGPGRAGDADDEEGAQDDEDSATTGARIAIPSETFMEELSQHLELHPFSVYWLIREGIERAGWRCRPEEQRATSNRYTVLILRLLGHRWPIQVEAGEPKPDWADEDGILPLTEGTGHPTLLSRVRERLAADFPGGDVAALEREFQEIMEKPLEQWLETEFFKHHVSQFRKRPIAWQLQSGSYRKGRTPAFACLIYYHALDADLIPKLRNHYVGSLRRRLATELGSIEAVSVQARTDRQQRRQIELEGQLEELTRFDKALEQVEVQGFQSNALGLNGAKDVWIRQMREILGLALERIEQDGSAEEWRKRAGADDPELGDKLLEALKALPDHCGHAARNLSQGFSDALEPDTIRSRWLEPIDALDSSSLPFLDRCVSDAFQAVFDAWERDFREWKRQTTERMGGKVTFKTENARASRLEATMRTWRWTDPSPVRALVAALPLFDEISASLEKGAVPTTPREFVQLEARYFPDTNDGVRVNITPLQKAGLLATDVVAAKDVEKAIADRAEWRADERRWVREAKLPRPGWWEEEKEDSREH